MIKHYQELIERALEEDGAYADITTLSTVSEDQQAQAMLLARQVGVVAGLTIALDVFRTLDERIEVEVVVQDGVTVEANAVLARLHGSARSILSAERVALNFLGRLSGVATLTAQCVHVVEGTHTRILDTRKTTPTLRQLEKTACDHASHYRSAPYGSALAQNRVRVRDARRGRRGGKGTGGRGIA